MTIDRILPLGDIRHVLMERRAPTFEMIIGMIANRVSGLDNLREDIRVFVDILADHEEGSFDMIAVENSEHFRRHFGNGSIVESEINRLPRMEDAVRVERLPYVTQFYQANEDAPRMAASESLRTEMETGILPFHIGMRLASKASRIGSMIQCPDLVSPPKRMMASGEEK